MRDSGLFASVTVLFFGMLLGLCACSRTRLPSKSERTIKVRSREDIGLAAAVVSRRPLLYRDGPDPALDRPGHVRAGSCLSWFADRLAVFQDDTLFVALVDPDTAQADSLALPAGKGGVRCFSKQRGNKSSKADWEACFTHESCLYGLGSGSRAARERVAVITQGAPGTGPSTRIVDARRLYAALREREAFAGSELNLEGALVREGRLVLFQRGNGARRGGLHPVDATCELDLGAFLAFLDDPTRAPVPAVEGVTNFDLGSIDGVRLTFTDATLCRGRVVFLASAEDSPDAIRDGPVTGVALGVFDSHGDPRWCRVREKSGAPLLGKAEGVALDAADPTRAWLVLDRDDPDTPAEICSVRLQGFLP